MTTSRVSPYTFSVLKPLPSCFITEQSAVKTSLFVKYKTVSKKDLLCANRIFRIREKFELETGKRLLGAIKTNLSALRTMR